MQIASQQRGPAVTGTGIGRRGMSRMARREAMWFYGLVGIWIVGFILFTGGPILASAYLSFTKYDIVTPPRWVGLWNYGELFTNDPLFWQSLKVTFVYSIMAIPIG